ncbi:MAG: hypothetical protein MMC23_001050 [Stictis urceolatum]|nr:hypothetical protein [Stictis urceolata]
MSMHNRAPHVNPHPLMNEADSKGLERLNSLLEMAANKIQKPWRLARLMCLSTTAACTGIFAVPFLLNNRETATLPASAPQKKLLRFVEDHTYLSASGLKEGRWHTLLTHSFQHGNIPHIFVNLSTLMSMGPLAGVWFGPGNLVSLWVGGAIAGGACGVAAGMMKAGINPTMGQCGYLCGFQCLGSG